MIELLDDCFILNPFSLSLCLVLRLFITHLHENSSPRLHLGTKEATVVHAKYKISISITDDDSTRLELPT